MSNPDNICPACGQSNLVNGTCPLCGFSETNLERGGDQPMSRRGRAKLWVWFWLLFLGTPVLSVLGLASPGGGIGVIFLLAGTIGAGFVLARIFAKDSTMFIVLGIVFSVGVAAVYFGIVFVGCLMVLKGSLR